MKPTKHECQGCGENKVFRADQLYCSRDCLIAHIARVRPVAKVPVEIPHEGIVDIELQKLRDKKEGKDKTNKILQSRVLLLERSLETLLSLKDKQPDVIDILPKVASGKSESVMNVVLSDWHIEETVLPEQVSNKNTYNKSTVDARFLKLTHGIMAWWKIASRDTTIRTIVVALLGDFITGSIHDDLAEGNRLPPADAIHEAFGRIASLIKFLLENLPREVSLIIPCHSGNHGRMTHEQRIATESGNSLEYFMYLMLRDYFQDEKRLKFIVQPGYHSYVRFFEGAYETRFHHGHQINYQGGVGGITIPVNKSIAQWNKAKPVDLDVFGHFHTRFDGGNFIANGSMIGYNAYAVSIKASFEQPSQQVFLINREYSAKTLVAPIFLY